MKFEDTGLPDSPMMRRAFLVTEMDALGCVIVTDDGKRLPSSMDLQLRTADILQQTVPGATEEQIAGALMFLTSSFNRSGAVLMQRSGDDKLMPNVCAWSQEWQDVQKARKQLGDASRELRQIITAASVARMEDYKKNFASLDQMALAGFLSENDMMTFRMGDIGAPQLESISGNLGQQMNRLLRGLPAEEPATAVATDKAVTTMSRLKFKPRP